MEDGQEYSGLSKNLLCPELFSHVMIFDDGASTSGKSREFGSRIPRFESWRPNQNVKSIGVRLNNSLVESWWVSDCAGYTEGNRSDLTFLKKFYFGNFFPFRRIFRFMFQEGII